MTLVWESLGSLVFARNRPAGADGVESGPSSGFMGLLRLFRNGHLYAAMSLAVALGALAMAGAQALAAPGPSCPTPGRMPVPAFAPAGAPPAVAIWHDLDGGPGGLCAEAVRGHVKLAVALAARFRGPRSLKGIAARIGAVSATSGLRYWSTTDGNWRVLIAEATALREPSEDATRPDFAADEVLAGGKLFFRQDDTRSTGWNLYSLTARRDGPDRLVVTVVNLTAIRFLLVPLAAPGDLVSVHVIARLGPRLWGYYGLSAVRGGGVEAFANSLVNRAAAFYRFLTGRPGDAAPPLAP